MSKKKQGKSVPASDLTNKEKLAAQKAGINVRGRVSKKQLTRLQKLVRTSAAKKGHKTRRKIAKEIERKTVNEWEYAGDETRENFVYHHWQGPPTIPMDAFAIAEIVENEATSPVFTGTISWVDKHGQHYRSAGYQKREFFERVIEELQKMIAEGASDIDAKRVVYIAFTGAEPLHVEGDE